MALRRLYCFDKLPRGVIAAEKLPGGLNRGNGLSYLNDPALTRLPDIDAANPLQTDNEGYLYCPQFPQIGSAVIRMLSINPIIFKEGWTKQFYGMRVKIHRETQATTANAVTMGLFETGKTTNRMSIFLFNELLAALGGYFIEGYLEFVASVNENVISVDVYLNGKFLKTASVLRADYATLFRNGGLSLGLCFRGAATTPRSTSIMYKDIIAYDDVLDEPSSLVSLTGPVRVKPIYVEEVQGEGWSTNGESLDEVVNRTIDPNEDPLLFARNDLQEQPLDMKLKVDLDSNLPVYGVCFDVTLNTGETGRVNYDLEIKDGAVARSVLKGEANDVPVWGVTSPTLGSASDGSRWTVEKLNRASLKLKVKTV